VPSLSFGITSHDPLILTLFSLTLVETRRFEGAHERQPYGAQALTQCEVQAVGGPLEFVEGWSVLCTATYLLRLSFLKALRA